MPDQNTGKRTNTIIALVHPDNRASIRVAEKLKMSFVGHEQYFGMAMNKYQRYGIITG